MHSRPLGSTGIAVSAIGFGTWALGGSAHGTLGYGTTNDDESRQALAEALARGCTLFDTSNLYGWGHAEALLGEALRDERPRVVIATKAGYATPDGTQDFSPGALRRSLEGSLRRLRTDYVDLLQLHNPPSSLATGGAAVFDALRRMRDDGMIRAFGVSAQTPDDALLFARTGEPATLQVNFNLGDLRAARNGLFDLCRERRIGLIVRTPLAAGFLTGCIADDEVFGPTDHRHRFDAGMRARWTEAVGRMRPLFADASAATPAQNALRFCLSFDSVSVVIPGMMRAADVVEDLAAAALPPLTAAQRREVETVYDEVFG